MTRLSQYINSRLLHQNSSGVGNIPYLDGVRGLAILMVITIHLFEHSVVTDHGFPIMLNLGKHSFDIKNLFMSGAYGVRLFFVLSAFLLFIPYARTAIRGSGKVDIKRFYWRRIKRILPAYLSVLFVMCLVGWLGHYAQLNKLNFLLNTLFIHPFFFFRNDVYCDFIPGTWSLVTEVRFYLILPFIAWFFLSLKRGVPAALALMTLSFFYRAYIAAHVAAPGPNMILGHNILAHIDIFGLGMLAALIYVKYTECGWNISPWVPNVLLISGVVVYCRIFSGGIFFLKDFETLLGLSFFVIVIGLVSGPSPARRLMEWEPLRVIGLISYSMFLINDVVAIWVLGPLMNILSITKPFARLAFNMTAGVFALSAISMLSYLYIERPFLTGKKNRRAVSESRMPGQPSPEISSDGLIPG